MYKILIIEDDLIIAKTLKSHMLTWGYETEYITDFKNVIAEFISFDPQLILLDISLPFYNGYHWCSEIRKISKVPIIFISSASDNLNIVMAINQGGDDFIAKPFDLNIITAKVQAILRRTYDFAVQNNLLEHNNAIFNVSDGTITYNHKKIELSKNESKIIQLLLENKGRIVSRDTVMIKLWEDNNFVDDNTLTVNIARIRKKLDEIGLIEFIKTKKGLGYIIE